MALYQAFRVLRYAGRQMIFSQEAVNAVRTIRYCVIILVAFIAGAEAYLILVQRGKEDDIAGGVAMGLVAMLISVVIAAVATVFEGMLRSAIDTKLKTAVPV